VEIESAIDFNNSNLVHIYEGTGTGCGNSGIRIQGIEHNILSGTLNAYIHKWNFQFCEAYFSINAWLIINKIPDNIVMEFIIYNEGH